MNERILEAPKNPELESAMHEVAKNDNAQTREALYKAILGSTFLVQGTRSRDLTITSGERKSDGGTRVAFQTIEHPPGRIVLPVFTDISALNSWAGEGSHWIGLGAQALFQAIAPGTIAEVRINAFRQGQPIARPGGIVTRNEFVALAQGLMPERTISNVAQMKVAAGQKLVIGAPAKVLPAELMKAVVEYLADVVELHGAYLFQMTNQNVTTSVIGLEFAPEPDGRRMEQIIGGLGGAMRGKVPAGMALDFMPLKGAFLESVRKCARVLVKR